MPPVLRAAILIAALAAAVLIGPAALADPPAIALRTGDHPGFGRVVFDLPVGVSAVAAQDGDRVTIRFDPAGIVRAGAEAPRNVRGITFAAGQAEVVLAPGAQIRPMRMDGKLVIDVLDPSAHTTPTQATHATASPAVARAVRPSPIAVTLPLDRHDDPVPVVAEKSPAEKVAPAEPGAIEPPALSVAALPAPIDPTPVLTPGDITTPATIALAATPALLPPGVAGRGVTLPFDAGVGAAAFRRGGSAIVVFDERRPIDMAALRADPVFASGTIELLPGATVLRLALPPQAELRLQRAAAGWTVASVPRGTGADTDTLRPIRPEPADGVVHLLADAPGQVVSMPDPDTGGMLLIGTQLRPGQAVAVARTAPEFALLPTWQGVAVEPLSDGLTLRVGPPGFVMAVGAGRELALAATAADLKAVADAQHFSRRYDFPALPAEGLMWRVQSAVDTAAATPAQGRATARIAVAQAMLAAGMGVEAQSVLTLAAEEDGRAADDPDAIGLSAIAAMLAGRLDQTDGIDDSRLTGSDEIALWRAVCAAMRQPGSPQAAPVFAVEVPLLLSYPAMLRDRLLPLAAETMALGGEREAAKQLLESRAADHSLDLARGFLLQEQALDAGGDAKPALQVYDRLTDGSDRLVRARAATRAVELRLAAGALTPAQAADALDKLIYSWRGDARELTLRLRVADLRRQAGEWRPALALLRETEQVWPAQRPALHARLGETFADALAHDAETPLPPLDLVALADENADLLPEGEAGQALAARLADRLAALDLPARAVPVLEKLAASAPAGPARGAFGGRLATMRLEQGDAAGALAALAASDAPSLPTALVEGRTMTFARAAASSGEMPRAAAALAALDTPAADGLRADLMEGAKDWPAAAAALHDYAAKTVPADGPLDDAQARTLLRLASAAAQVGDDATLARLREHDTPRLPPGKLAEMFRLVTAGPVQGVADLPRAGQETKLAGDLPVALKALTPQAIRPSMPP
jgi:hypothetical protein